MPTPDVKVKLSAEGEKQVINALKKVQAEGQKASKGAAQGFGGLNKVLGSTTQLLGTLGVAIGFIQIKNLIHNSIEAADALNKMAAKTGATTENLSALSFVARLADSNLEQVGNALVRMNKNIGDAAAGIPTAAAAFRDLGLDMKDFKGKDSVQIFELIAKRIDALPDSIKQGRSAMQIFGKAGALLLPTLRALAEEGLAGVTERAKQLGVVISSDVAAAGETLKDDMEIIRMQSEAAGASFISGFGPELSQVLQAMSGNLGETTNDWKAFGQGVGLVVKFIVGTVGNLADFVATSAAMIAFMVVEVGRASVAAMNLNFGEAKSILENAGEALLDSQAQLMTRMKNRFEMTFQIAPAPEATRAVTGGAVEGEDPAELAARRAQALRAALDQELALTRAHGVATVASEKRAFDEGLQSVRDFYAARRQAAEDAFTKTEEVLQKKRETLAAEIDPAKAQQEADKIEAQLAAARLAREEAIAQATFEETQAVRALAAERLALEQKLLDSQGKRFESMRLGIDEELRQTDLLLRKQGVGDDERIAKVEELRRALESGIAFEEMKAQADEVLIDLDGRIAEIQAKVAAGLLSQLEGESQIIALEEGRIGTLRELAAALEEAAQATGDPAKIAQAQQFAAAVDGIGFAVEGAKTSFRDFARTAVDAGTDALVNFFDSGIEGAKNLGDAFRGMAAGIVQQLRRMAAELLAVAIMKRLAGFFGLGFAEGGEVPAEGFARGGQLPGRGTGTSDSNLAFFSKGEFLVRAAVVDQPGVLSHLEELNRRGAQAIASPAWISRFEPGAFATGGLVDGAAGAGDGMTGRLDIGLDEGLILKALQTSEGQRVFVDVAKKNRRALGSALGGR